MTNQHLHLIITGGTIDSVFDGTRDGTVVNDHSVIATFLERVIKPHFSFSSEIVTLKDSRQITDNIRADIVDSIRRVPHRNILITHGTYTMPETAVYLAQRRTQFEDRTIVLTGSFYPLQNFAESDAPFNLGFAIASVFNAAPGVHLAMNGRLFPAGTVYKNLEIGRFEEKRA
jgi:L-asparaginase